MAAPASAEEFTARFARNERISGYGVGRVTGRVLIFMPCPFCAAPDFLIYEILDVRAAMTGGASCAECGRGMRAIFNQLPHSGGVVYEFVQTTGPDPDAWAHHMRRVSNGDE